MSRRKLEQQVLDYDDLLLYWHVMMQDAALAAEIGARFDHVLVDEYQDTNTLQADILLRAEAGRRRPDASSATMRRRSTRSAPRRSRTSSSFPAHSRRRHGSSRSKTTTARRKPCSTPPMR